MKKFARAFTCLLLAAALLCGAALPASAAVADISGHWGAAAIQYCIDHGYMTGVSGTAFNPNGYVQRCQVAQALYNLAGKPSTGGTGVPFTDTYGHWAEDAIAWSHNAGVVKGVSSTAFDPDSYVTRGQVATMFMRYAQLDASNKHNNFTIDPNVLNLYPDQGQILSWYREGMAWAAQYGFMQGSGGRLNPAGTLTRAELAQLIKNYFEPLEGVQPDPDGKYHSVELFLSDPMVKEQLDKELSSLETEGMDVTISGDKDTLYYTFTFARGQVADQAAVGKQLQETMREDAFADTFISIANAMKAVLVPEIYPLVTVAYYDFDGTLLASLTYCDAGSLE